MINDSVYFIEGYDETIRAHEGGDDSWANEDEAFEVIHDAEIFVHLGPEARLLAEIDASEGVSTAWNDILELHGSPRWAGDIDPTPFSRLDPEVLVRIAAFRSRTADRQQEEAR